MGCPVVKKAKARARGWPGRMGRSALMVLNLGLAYCALTPASAPVPVEDRAPVPAPVPESAATPVPAPASPEPLPEALPLPTPPAAPDRQVGTSPVRPPAVVALLDRVDSASARGNPGQAAAELERALRISPRDGGLWLRLARVRMQQNQWQQAEAVALKCVSLPESDAPTKQAAWNLIGSARAARGDAAGAAAARQRAASFNPAYSE